MQHRALDPSTHAEIVSQHLYLGHEISRIWTESTVLVQLCSKLPDEVFQCWLSILVHKLHCRGLEAVERLNYFKELHICNLCEAW